MDEVTHRYTRLMARFYLLMTLIGVIAVFGGLCLSWNLIALGIEPQLALPWPAPLVWLGRVVIVIGGLGWEVIFVACLVHAYLMLIGHLGRAGETVTTSKDGITVRGGEGSQTLRWEGISYLHDGWVEATVGNSSMQLSIGRTLADYDGIVRLILDNLPHDAKVTSVRGRLRRKGCRKTTSAEGQLGQG